MSNLIIVDGINVRRDMAGRYCLNDLHRAAGGEERHKPPYWLRNAQTEQL
ncbi:KilA-N domain-containing protein, partial [Morganella morganii]